MAIKSDLMRYLYQFKEWSMQFDIRALLRNSSLWGKPAPDKLPIPPARFRIKVTGTADIDWFLTSGELAFNSMVTVLSWRNIDLENLKSVLDFGCGCGRVLRYWFNYHLRLRLQPAVSAVVPAKFTKYFDPIKSDYSPT